MDFLTATEQLGKDGVFVWPNFVTGLELEEIRADLARIREQAGFERAGTGRAQGNDVRDQVRRDEVHWIERDSTAPAQMLLWEKLDLLKQTLNRSLYLGISRFDGHYSIYPPGGFYKRHLDCFQDDRSRVVSLILYLNLDWQETDGGQLRLYHEGSEQDISPKGGTLVCFLSREVEHEVLLSHATRLSFTGWFK